MRKLAGITIVSFAALAVAGTASSAVGVGGGDTIPTLPAKPEAWIIVEKDLPDDHGAELPPVWAFRVDSLNCGNAIITQGGLTETAIVEVPAAGGESAPLPITLGLHAQPAAIGVNGFGSCDFRIIELDVEGWEAVSPPGGVTEVEVELDDTVRVPFENEPGTPTTTTVAETTTTVAETTTTVAETTTTAADTTTTAAPTTAPPTTGTVAPELPETGSSSALTGLLAALLVLGGLGAVVASRRT